MLNELRESLRESFDHARARPGPASPDSMPWVRAVIGNQIQLIAFEDIACARSVPGYTQVCTSRGEFLINEPVKKLMERLDAKRFVQVHRAAIVNLHFVARIRRNRPGHFTVELKHGLGEVESSRARGEIFREL